MVTVPAHATACGTRANGSVQKGQSLRLPHIPIPRERPTEGPQSAGSPGKQQYPPLPEDSPVSVTTVAPLGQQQSPGSPVQEEVTPKSLGVTNGPPDLPQTWGEPKLALV